MGDYHHCEYVTILYRMARLLRGTDNLSASEHANLAGKLLAELQDLDPEKYENDAEWQALRAGKNPWA